MVKHIILWQLKKELSPEEKEAVMLDSAFEDYDALKAYSVNPKHVAVADGKVRPFTAHRSCLDYTL